MDCKKCKTPIEEGQLYCTACGDRFAVNEQKKKIAETRDNMKNIIVKQAKTPIFLVVAICFSAMFASSVISMFTGLPGTLITGILPFIFGLITVIGLWKTYTAKTPDALVKSLRQASIYDAYTRVMYTISIVLVSIFAVIVFVLMLLGGGLMSEITGGEGDAMTGGLVAAIVSLVIFGIVITVISIFRSIFANRRKYFLALTKTAESGEYTAAKAPVIGSYILGGWTVLSAIFPILLAASADVILGSLLSSLGEAGAVVETIFDTFLSGVVFSSMGSLLSGGYMICSAVWMSSVHKSELENKKLIAKETARLETIEAETQQAILEAERKRREADEKAKKAAEEESRRLAEESRRAAEEARRAEEERTKKLQEQQQQMFQMMMMQMAQNNANAQNMQEMIQNMQGASALAQDVPAQEVPAQDVPAQEVPAEETPVEEAPVEEAPVEEAPVEEAPVEEAPVEEAPVEEAPVEETPVEEAPAEETPVEEAPATETTE